MNPFINKFVDDGFFNETVGNFLQEALDNKESIIIAGHRSAGTRGFMANLMASAKKAYQTVQIKKPEQVDQEAEYYLVPGIPNIDFEALIGEVIQIPDSAFISIKEPEQPLSLMKLFKGFAKAGKPTAKKIHQVECDKKDGVPYVKKVTTYTQGEDGKVSRVDLDFEEVDK